MYVKCMQMYILLFTGVIPPAILAPQPVPLTNENHPRVVFDLETTGLGIPRDLTLIHNQRMCICTMFII